MRRRLLSNAALVASTLAAAISASSLVLFKPSVALSAQVSERESSSPSSDSQNTSLLPETQDEGSVVVACYDAAFNALKDDPATQTYRSLDPDNLALVDQNTYEGELSRLCLLMESAKYPELRRIVYPAHAPFLRT